MPAKSFNGEANGLRVGRFAPEDPVGVAVALVRGPGVAAGACAASRALGDRVQETGARSGLRRRRSSRSVLAPASSTAHPAAMTQRTPMPMSFSATVAANRARSYFATSCPGLRAREMATIDEHELRHDAHALDFARPEKAALGQHDAARIAIARVGAARRRIADNANGRLAMAGDVHDPPIASHQRVDDRARIGTGLRSSSGLMSATTFVRAQRSLRREPPHDRSWPRRARPAVSDTALGSQSGSPITRIFSSVRRLELLATELGDRSFRMSFERIAQGGGRRCRHVGIEQLPRNAGGPGIDLDHHFERAPEERLQLDRHQQRKQRASDLVIDAAVVRGRFDEPPQERTCVACARISVRARFVSSV
jgi:hypothetical protein